jgi:membrane fusion protein, multidrug efflux system
MSTKKRAFLMLAVILFVIAIGWIGFLYRQHSSGSAGANTETIAKVRIAQVQLTTMHKKITAYGSVIAAPENLRVYAVPFESKISRVTVTPGQMVRSGTVLMEVEPSHEAMLQLEEAKLAQKTAAIDVEQARKRLELKLGTIQELTQAQQALELAQVRIANLESRGIKNGQVTAQTDGLVDRIDAQPGQIVPAGNPLIEIAAGDKLEIRLGVEPADAAQLQTGLNVEIHNVNATEPNNIIGHLRLVSQRINPSTRLVDVIVAVPERCPLLLDTYVCGKIIVASRQTLVVPRSAILTDGEHYSVFTVKDGKAVKHIINVGLEDDIQAEVITDQLKANDPVIVEGNYELEDGMAVDTEDGR